MAARSTLRALGLVPGAATLQVALRNFAAKGPGVVCALTSDLLSCAHDFAEEHDSLEVIGLGELVKRCLAFCEEEAKPTCGSALFEAALAKAAEPLDSDSPFYSSKRFPGFHKATARTLGTLREWRISPERLEDALADAEHETGRKMASLAVLEREAGAIVHALGRETVESQMERCLECKPAVGCSLPRTLMLTASEASPLLAAWIQWLSQCEGDITVAMDLHQPSPGLFPEAALLARLLEVEVEPIGEPNDLCSVLFTERPAAGLPNVQIASCSDVLAEAEWALRACLADNKSGLAWGEIAIYARNLEDYAAAIETAATRLGVPIRLARRAPVLTNRFARLALEALEFAALDDPRLLIPLAGCTYLGLDAGTRTDLKQVARTAYKARKNAWAVMAGWAEKHQPDLPWLGRLLAWREEARKTSLPLFSWNDRLRGLVEILPWHGSEGPSRPRDLRVQTAMRRAIASVASVGRVSQDAPISLSEFLALCRTVWRDEEYTIPARETGVQVASSAQRLGAVKSLYALGMLEGVFPRRRSEDPILNDPDREEISRVLNLDPRLPNSFDRAKRERDEFYRLCAAAERSLWLSYPQADDTRDNVPAFYLKMVEGCAKPMLRKHDFPRVPFAPPSDDCHSEADLALRHAMDGPREEPLAVHFVSKEIRDQMAWPADQPFTPQDLREALRCEFQHFVSRRLDLRSNRELNRWSRLRKLPHGVRLMQQPSPDSARHALEAALEAELDELYGEAPEWELSLLRSGGKRLIGEWIKREFAARQIWPRDTSSLEMNPAFGSQTLQAEMPGGIGLQGFAAATSTVGPYAVTHLYESQPPLKKSSFGGTLAELDTLYYGLHLLARHRQGKAPAVEVESMSGERTLLVLPRLAEMPLPSRIQDGLQVVDLAGPGEGAMAQKAFYDEVKRRLRRAVASLKQSGIEPMPGEHCRWCGYGELCRRSQEFSEDSMPGLEDSEELPND